MELSENSKLVCIFCYKNVDEPGDCGNQDVSQKVKRFCKFLGRLSSKKDKVSVALDQQFATCDACVKIVDSFNELYYQIQCLQLQLIWRLHELKNVMKLGDKIPAKVKAFRERYGTSAVSQGGNDRNMLLETRNRIKFQANKYISHSSPRVQLGNQVPEPSNFSRVVHLPNHLQELNETTYTKNSYLLRWMTTFIAVVVSYCYFPNKVSPNSVAVAKEKEINQCDQSVSAVPSSPTENFDDAYHGSPDEPDPCYQSDICHSSDENDQMVEHLPTEILQEMPDNSTSSVKHNFIASNHFTCKIENLSVLPGPSHVSNVESFQRSPKSYIIKKIKSKVNTTPLTSTSEGVAKFSNEASSTSRQLRAKFKCVVCNQTFSSLARLEAHKTSCDCDNLNETDEEENATTALLHEKDDGEFKKSSQKFESYEEGDDMMECSAFDSCHQSDSCISNDQSMGMETDPPIIIVSSQSQSAPDHVDHDLIAAENLHVVQQIPTSSVQRISISSGLITVKNQDSNVVSFEHFPETNIADTTNSTCNTATVPIPISAEIVLNSKDKVPSTCKNRRANFKCVRCRRTFSSAARLNAHKPSCARQDLNEMCEEESGTTITSLPTIKNDDKYCKKSKKFKNDEKMEKSIMEYSASNPSSMDAEISNDKACSPKDDVTLKKRKRKLVVNSVFRCDICSLQFPSPTQLLLHRRAVHPGVSRRENGDVSLTVQHLIEKRNAKFHCPVDKCEGKYFSQEELDTHSKLHGNFSCEFCSVVKTSPFDSALHEVEHHNKKGTDFKCQRCSFSSTQRNKYLVHYLEKHLKVSLDTIKCPGCEKRFNDVGQKYRDDKFLKRQICDHYNLCHNNSKSVEKLNEIYKKSNGQVELSDASIKLLKITPAQIILKEFEFTLEICNLEGCEPGLYTSNDLEYHKNMHGHFKCSSCEFNCNYAPTLVLHELEHASNQPDFSCPHCTDLKMDKMDYKKHFFEHHLEKSVKFRDAKCPVCFLTFPEDDQVPLAHFVNEHDLSRLNDPEKVEMCNEEGCSAYFLTRIQLIGHSKIVHNKTKQILGVATKFPRLVECLYTCDVCQLKFPEAGILNGHRRKVHRKRTNKSITTGDTIISEDGMTVNDFVTKRNAKFHCSEDKCDGKYLTESERDIHVKLHGSFQCNVCPVTKTFAPDLAVHELQHTEEEKSGPFSSRASFKCSRCTFSSKLKNKYIFHHLEKHLNLSPDKLKCHICQMIFHTDFEENQGRRLSDTVLSHYIIHHDTSELEDKTAVFNCAHCSAYFLALHQLQLHNLRIHTEQSNASLSLACVDCNKQLAKRKAFLEHRFKVHHNHDDSGYEFVCEVTNCQKRFEYKVDLDRHSGWHSTNIYSPKACPECGKILLDKLSFSRHVQSHRGQVCEQCGKEFKSKPALTRHMLSHSGPETWEFVCEVCSKKCMTKGKLEEHMRSHTKANPFVCETCGATYAHRHNWRHHMLSKHEVKVPTQKFDKTGNMTSQKGVKRKRETTSSK